MKNSKQKIRLGVFGASRGWSFMSNAQSAGMEVVAVCDQNEALREKAKKEFNLVAYAEFDDMLAHDIVAVGTCIVFFSLYGRIFLGETPSKLGLATTVAGLIAISC